MKEQAQFRTVKMFDIAYISTLYFLAAFAIAKRLDDLFIKIFGEIDNKNPPSQIIIILEVITQISITSIISYLARNIIQLLPSPFHDVYGLDHLRVKEVAGGAILTTYLFFYQKSLQNKLVYLRNMI
jgi:hypothetical protein